MIKCIIWDLDDTIWEGTLSDTGYVTVNQEIINYIKKFDKLGIIQSIVSKNNYEDAQNKLKESLINEYFIYPQINYSKKTDNIVKIVERFNISYDSIVFIDDNDFERYSVNSFLPEIITIPPNEIEQVLLICNDALNSTTNHRKLMQLREERLTASERFKGTHEEFLMTCNMEITVRKAVYNDIDRVFELASRTNKLNNLTEKVNKDYISSIIANEYNNLFVCELNDIFGYHGIVGVCIISFKDSKAVIELFCISCRIEGRGIGTVFIQEVIDRLIMQNKDIDKIECRYESNKKNVSSLLLLKIIGFKIVQSNNKSTNLLELNIPYKKNNVRWIRINER